MTSSELRKKHHELEIEERKDRAETEFGMAMHQAEMEVKTQYLGFVKNNLVEELNAPERQVEMKNHASVLVTQVLSGISGLSSMPRLAGGSLSALPAPRDVELETDMESEWLARVNARVEQERATRRLSQETGPVTGSQAALSAAAGEEEQAARLARLAAAAEAQGYSLAQLERMVGLDSNGGAKKNG